MAAISDFLKIPKIDSCKHLSSGMKYDSFTQWAGFLLPGYDELKSRPAGSVQDLAIRKDFNLYTQTRISSAHDILLLFCHAISESISDNVKLLNGTVNVDFLSKCKNATEFLDIVKKICEKYSDKITVRPFLGIDTSNENNLPLAEMLLESGLFGGIELYGTKFIEMPEKFLSLFRTSRRMNIDSRICCLGFHFIKSREEIFEILDNLKPTLLLNPNMAVNNESLGIIKNSKLSPEIVAFGKNTGIKVEFSPAPGLSGNKDREKNLAIRDFAENGIPLKLCTEDPLHLGKSISEFASDLCNEGVFSVEEIGTILKI